MLLIIHINKFSFRSINMQRVKSFFVTWHDALALAYFFHFHVICYPKNASETSKLLSWDKQKCDFLTHSFQCYTLRCHNCDILRIRLTMRVFAQYIIYRSSNSSMGNMYANYQREMIEEFNVWWMFAVERRKWKSGKIHNNARKTSVKEILTCLWQRNKFLLLNKASQSLKWLKEIQII